MKVSVIIPVYGVERFIRRCLDSVMQQSYNDMEIIIIDDCSRDRSMDIVEEVVSHYPLRNIKIIRHNQNYGLPAARNTGLRAATGEYIYHVDGDDFIDQEMINDMVQATENGNVDIVYSDWYLNYGAKERYMVQPSVSSSVDMLESILSGKMKFNVWNKLVRRSLYTDNSIYFPMGYSMGEDMTMIKIVGVARSVNYVPKAYYHYVKTNSEAMTENLSEKSFTQIEYNVKSAMDFLITSKLADEHSCNIFKLTIKYPLLFTSDTSNYKIWKSWFQESNKDICNDTFGIHTKIIQFMAVHEMRMLLKLHFHVYNLIYKLIYK